MTEEIERLTVTIEANIKPLLKGAKEGVAEVEDELKDLEKTGKRAFENTGKAAKGLSATMTAVISAATALVAVFATQAVNRIVGFFTKIGGAAIQANAQFEVFTSQFETLLGSADAAKQRLDELAQFGVETPFELPEVVQASRVLEVFGGSLLSTGENLRMIGDVAAGVNQPFADVAMWIGRMYDAMASGRPFGEAAMRLQEMGALSGQARAELEKLQKSGASGEEMWAAFNEQVGSKFAGNMERLSQTFQGVTSNLVDFRDNLMRIGGEPLFEEVRDSAAQFLEIISEPQMQEAINSLARSFGELAASLVELSTTDALAMLGGIDPQAIEDLATSFQRLEAALDEFLGRTGEADSSLNEFVRSVEILTNILTLHTNQWNTFNAQLEQFGEFGREASDVLGFLQENMFKLLTPSTAVNTVFAELSQRLGVSSDALADATSTLAEASETQAQKLEKAREAAASYGATITATMGRGGPVEEAADVQEEVNEQLEKGRALLENLADEFIDLTEERNERIAELEEDHIQNVINLETDYINRRLELGHELAEDLAELDEETAKKRAKVIEDTRSELAKLEADTDRSINEQRDQFQRDELRETEDHLRSMRELRNRYLMDIEDAVKNRDARALVDAQRRFREESQQREQEFGIDQRRDREDQDLRLRQIRENEQRRATEIMQQQERALQQLAEHEREQRQKIQEGFREEMAELDAEHTEKMLKEDQQFTERQNQLEEMLTKRLETVAKELAREKELNAEGAQAVLETLDEVFGIGGDIDKLMEDFAKRRSQQLVVDVEVRRQFGESVPAGTPANISTRPTSTPERIPAFQHGGTLLATKPTLAQFGEVPEMVTFTPLSQMNNTAGQPRQMEIDLKMSGSAPPGVRSADRDAIAGVLANALREAGAMVRQSGR